MPKIRDLSEGLGRRLDIVPFKVRFVREPKFPNEEKLIPNIKTTLQEEREGIFAFAIDGLKRLIQNKYEFSECPAVEEQREKIGKMTNLCHSFASVCLEVDNADDWKRKTKKNGKVVVSSLVETRSRTDDLFASFIGWCLTNEHEREAKVMSMAGFLKDFRATLQEKYDFGLSEEGTTICENEEKSNNVQYFNCVRLNDDGEDFIDSGQEFIEKHNLRTKKSEKNTRTASSIDEMESEV
jgi:phage/plasmid-associated DNA primase